MTSAAATVAALAGTVALVGTMVALVASDVADERRTRARRVGRLVPAQRRRLA